MAMNEPITVDDYKNVSEEFFGKYNYVVERMGPGPNKAEDVLKVMEALSAQVIKERVKNKIGPFGFNKKTQEEE
jgi:hypothetical protein|tara:strand:- start:8854 stop:9075 length:222 start_codon:yes stop_codon:yes gene_type:complete